MVPLPIDPHLPHIVQALRQSGTLVLVAPPGAGKTTRLPPAMLRGGLLSRQHPRLVMLQPRRVAAQAAAQRMAVENHWSLGDQVGYHIRFEKRLAPHTPLCVLTEGILTRRLLADPFLEGVGAVVLDEFHERSIHSDLAIALLREVRQTVRPDLLLVVMSATIQAGPVADFLGCPVIEVPGRTFPIDIEYHPSPQGLAHHQLAQRIEQSIQEVLERDEDGDLLVFLPGMEEIRRTQHRLEPLARQHDLAVLPLHGSLSGDDQLLALAPSARRKVVLATNIAETSLTIDGVRTVIDCGLARVAEYDAARGLDRLVLKRISQASATQRAGRAGRTAPGRCIRLWSAKEQHALAPQQPPEVCRVDLAATVLALHGWGKHDVAGFDWFEHPPADMLTAAEELLTMLGALDAGRMTPLGRRMLSLPVHPRLARMLLTAARQGLAQPAAGIAALLSEKDILAVAPQPQRAIATVSGPSDVLWRLQLLDHPAAAAHGQTLHSQALRQVQRTQRELLRLVRKIPADQPPPQDPEPALLKLVLLAYPDRVARRRPNDPRALLLASGGAAQLADESVVRQGDLLVAVDARHDQRSRSRQALVRIASAIELEWLEQLLPQCIRQQRITRFDEQQGRVRTLQQVHYRQLLLRQEEVQTSAADAADALAEAAGPKARDIFEQHPAAAVLIARIDLLRRAMPQHPWPPLDPQQLAELLVPLCNGRRSLEDLGRAPLVEALMSLLAYPLDRLLEKEAPQVIEVPSGSRIRLDYQKERPVLPVRLQEIFGWTDTPTIAAGRVKVLLHLLGPNYRPVQITDDLRSFWAVTYPQVRKDLRWRYPRHSWPDDPLTAAPQAKGGRRRA